jgi:L-asparaginase
MQVLLQKNSKKIVVLGTGGTIAGTSVNVVDNIGYTAAQVGVAQLFDNLPAMADVLKGANLVTEQVAQIDSKDMSFAVWTTLAQRVAHYLTRPDVIGVVISHGTDTLEETAFFLHAVLPDGLQLRKPVVLTCAMRPASALVPDGPQNLMDAVAVALTSGACGVMALCAGTLHSALDVQKVHTYQLAAFSSGDGGAVGYVEEGVLRLIKNWPVALTHQAAIAIESIVNIQRWPRVEIVMNYAGVSGFVVDALLHASQETDALRGLVVSGTGNGTIHQDLIAALRRAKVQGVRVVRSTRCANGRVLSTENPEFEDSRGLSTVKARIALMLELMQV